MPDRIERRSQAIPTPIASEDTGVHDVDTRQRIRSKRSTKEAIKRHDQRLDKHDQNLEELTRLVTDTRGIALEMRGELKVLPELTRLVRELTSATVGDAADQRKTQRIDALDISRNRRKRTTLVIGGVIAVLTSAVALGWLAGHL